MTSRAIKIKGKKSSKASCVLSLADMFIVILSFILASCSSNLANTVNADAKQAIFRGSVRDLEDCIKKGFDPNLYDSKYDSTPIILAAQWNRPKIVEILIKHGANFNCNDKLGRTPLYWACATGSWGVVQSLLAHGADVNRKTFFGLTPLHIAVKAKHQFVEDCKTGMMAKDRVEDIDKVIYLLVQKGADVNIKDNEGQTPLDYALKNKLQDTITILQGRISK